MTTDKQKRAVAFCERWHQGKFEGDIENYNDVSKYLSQHLKNAKELAIEAACDYIAECYDIW